MSNGDPPGLCVSVLICTAGRPELLARALESLAAGSRPDQLVVVNGGDAAANDVVAEHAHVFAEVVLIQYANYNLSVSRNLGIPYCTGDILAMTDDDAEVSPDWIARIREAHAGDPHAGGIGGAVEGTRGDRFLSRLADLVVFPSFQTRRQVRTLPGVNVAYKRSVVAEVGYFDPSLNRGEDVDFNWRIQQLGYHLTYDPAIRVKHAHRSSLAGLMQQQYMYGRAYVLVRSKWPEMYCVYPHHLDTARDWAKLLHCLVAVLYQPALRARNMPRLGDALAAYPVLAAHHAVWKLGMLRQFLDGQRLELTAHPDPTITLYQRWLSGAPTDSQTSPQRVEPLPD